LWTSYSALDKVSIDGITRGLVSLYNPTTITRTFDYSGLGIGPHVLQVRAVNGTATVDAFITAAFFPTATQRTVIAYAYDPLYRLTQANATGALTYTFQYDYDAVGNRTTQTRTITSTQATNYVYDVANRLASVNGQAYTWDDNGNLVNDGEKTYTYDQANRLKAIDGGGIVVTYAYNGEGARLKQIVNGAPMTYTLDLVAPLVQVLVAQDSSGDTRYVYGVTRIGEQQSFGWLYHLTDALGSVRQLADDSGNVQLARGYTPYGEPLWLNGTASSRYAFTGEDYDPTVGLVFLRARYMQPTLGLFLAKDPWSGNAMRSGSMNGWNYVEENPIGYTDPQGLCRYDDTDCINLATTLMDTYDIVIEPLDVGDVCAPPGEGVPWETHELEIVQRALGLTASFLTATQHQFNTSIGGKGYIIRRVQTASGNQGTATTTFKDYARILGGIPVNYTVRTEVTDSLFEQTVENNMIGELMHELFHAYDHYNSEWFIIPLSDSTSSDPAFSNTLNADESGHCGPSAYACDDRFENFADSATIYALEYLDIASIYQRVSEYSLPGQILKDYTDQAVGGPTTPIERWNDNRARLRFLDRHFFGSSRLEELLIIHGRLSAEQ
jgi:RHS repeat-associated protein